MPEDLEDVDPGSTDLIFPKDKPTGLRFRLREPARYDADEVRDEIGGDIPEFGKWFPIEKAGGDDAWLASVGELVEELQRVENPAAVLFEVTHWEKSGSQQTDSYEVNLDLDGDSQQDSL